MNKSNIRYLADVFGFCLCLAFIIGFVYMAAVGCITVYAEAMTRLEAEYNMPVAPRIIVLEAPTREPEPIEEVVTEEEIDIVEEEATLYYDVPLSYELQDHIFTVCEEYDVDPALIFAMIRKESTYNPDAIGDSGRSFGLMQIQPRWHSERMAKLGCDNLLDPYQNVTVGVDFIAELLAKDRGVSWALMAYNGGPDYANNKAKAGKVSEYASLVMSWSNDISRG